MSICSYDGKRIIPAPQVEIVKTYQKSPNGEKLGKIYNLTITGTLIPGKGSPRNNKTFWTSSGYPDDEGVLTDERLGFIFRKQEALRELFSEDGKSLEFQSLDGSEPLKCNPRVISVSFPQGQWFSQCPYTITLEADVIYPLEENEDLSLVSDATETWQLDTDEQGEDENHPRIYRMSHTVSAVGKRFYDENGVLTKEPWQVARDYILPLLGFDGTMALSSGVNNLPSYYGGFNHTRSENRDEKGGAFSITENWIVASGKALEDFTVESSKDITVGTVRVSINGTITGFEERDANLVLSTSKYQNANDRFSTASGLALGRAQTYSGYSLNIIPLVERIGRNPVTGTITYGYEYDNRPSNLIAGALSEVITIVDSLDTNTIAIIPVLGRRRGPVLQDLGTSSELTRQLNIELVMPRANFGGGTEAELQNAFFAQRPSVDVSGIIRAADPINYGFDESYKQTNRESWEPKSGRYTREIVWVYE